MNLPNPLIPGFNPDPGCVLVDGTYYLVTSSFEYLPGLPIYRSTDFVAWEHIGNVATREEQVGIGHSPAGAGVWAPTIRHHNGRFHVIVSVTASPRGCVMFTAEGGTGSGHSVSVEWADGWPQPAPVDLQPRPEPVDEHCDFADDRALADPGWLAVGRTPAEVASSGERPGHLTIRAPSGGIDAFRPDFIGRRQRHLKSLFETTIDPADGRGGLGLRFSEDFTIALIAERTPSGTGTRVTARACLPTLTQKSTAELAGGPVRLRLETDTPPPGTTPWSTNGDLIRLTAVDATGTETRLAELDRRFWSVEMAAPFTGRVVGMFAEHGTVHFSDFRYHRKGLS
ncbi:family 43 glycosylhydrolase [Nonomuraea jabiensis]|uniref:family 43 glycosylhydrolase n=1 Tax=Nonomuraea jabiensis TaxID=882448 RepID=UPI003434865E